LRRGSIEFSSRGDDHVIRFERRLPDEYVVVLVNVSDAPASWPIDLANAAVLLSTDRARRSSGGELAPDEAVVLRP